MIPRAPHGSSPRPSRATDGTTALALPGSSPYQRLSVEPETAARSPRVRRKPEGPARIVALDHHERLAAPCEGCLAKTDTSRSSGLANTSRSTRGHATAPPSWPCPSRARYSVGASSPRQQGDSPKSAVVPRAAFATLHALAPWVRCREQPIRRDHRLRIVSTSESRHTSDIGSPPPLAAGTFGTDSDGPRAEGRVTDRSALFDTSRRGVRLMKGAWPRPKNRAARRSRTRRAARDDVARCCPQCRRSCRPLAVRSSRARSKPTGRRWIEAAR